MGDDLEDLGIAVACRLHSFDRGDCDGTARERQCAGEFNGRCSLGIKGCALAIGEDLAVAAEALRNRHRAHVGAIDETGYVQPTKQALRDIRGLNNVYHNNGIQVWWVRADGEVENVEIA